MVQNPAFLQFKKEFPELFKSYGDLYRDSAPHALDEKVKQLIYIGILTSCGYGPGLRVHIEKALQAGATTDQIKEAASLSIPAAGVVPFLEILPDLLSELKIDE